MNTACYGQAYSGAGYTATPSLGSGTYTFKLQASAVSGTSF